MYRNRYEDVVEPWKADLIISRARRMGFHRDELEDVQQEVILAVLNFRFDRDQANGAREATALTALIDRQLLTFRRAKTRYRNRLDRLRVELDAGRADPKGRHLEPRHESRANLIFDIRDALAQLSPQQREVCLALSEGHSVAKIARRLGCGWHTVNRELFRIREHFHRIGLDGWIGG